MLRQAARFVLLRQMGSAHLTKLTGDNTSDQLSYAPPLPLRDMLSAIGGVQKAVQLSSWSCQPRGALTCEYVTPMSGRAQMNPLVKARDEA